VIESSSRTNHSGGLQPCGGVGRHTTPRRTTQTALFFGAGALAVEPLHVDFIATVKEALSNAQTMRISSRRFSTKPTPFLHTFYTDFEYTGINQ
jgi:hypothetical protein